MATVRCFSIPVGADDLETLLTNDPILKHVNLSRKRLEVKKQYAYQQVNNADKTDVTYTLKKQNKDVICRRNRLSDCFLLTEEGKQRQLFVREGVSSDVAIVNWTMYCPGHTNCLRKCGEFGKCAIDCSEGSKRHSQHNCNVTVQAKIFVSDPDLWKVNISGSHVPPDIIWQVPTADCRIAETVKDDIIKARKFNQKPFDIFRTNLNKVISVNLEDALSDTRQVPSDRRIATFIKNHEKRQSYQGGQWTSVHKLAMGELMETGLLLYYKNDGTTFLLALSDEHALKSARKNSPIVGIDGKHGLQDDGACLMTAVSQHQSGFGCPVSFTIMNREHTDNIERSLRAIQDNVPCGDQSCSHPHRYHVFPDGSGASRETMCSRTVPYQPLVMIDKFEASASACSRLGLTYVLCWFHLVKAVMEKMKHLHIGLVQSYMIVMAFKFVARSTSMEEAARRWAQFLQFLTQLDIPAAKYQHLSSYFSREWWCDRWRAAWLDVTRRPITPGLRTMTTNNHDENLNLKVADCMGGRRKKISALVQELTGLKMGKEGTKKTTETCNKASLLKTQAAKTICNERVKQREPYDIQERNNHARLIYLTRDVRRISDRVCIVDDVSTKQKRFKDHKGNWVSMSSEKSEVLDELLSSMIPDNIKLENHQVCVDVDKQTCTCTDFIWRSSLRDPCVHLKTTKLFINECDKAEEAAHLCAYIRRKQHARPRSVRDEDLSSESNEIILQKLTDLYDKYGHAMWKMLSTSQKKTELDPCRPSDLPKVMDKEGRPKLRQAKPRPANPFLRKRKLNLGLESMETEAENTGSLKRSRNSARRAASKLVKRAKEKLAENLSDMVINAKSSSGRIIRKPTLDKDFDYQY